MFLLDVVDGVCDYDYDYKNDDDRYYGRVNDNNYVGEDNNNRTDQERKHQYQKEYVMVQVFDFPGRQSIVQDSSPWIPSKVMGNKCFQTHHLDWPIDIRNHPLVSLTQLHPWFLRSKLGSTGLNYFGPRTAPDQCQCALYLADTIMRGGRSGGGV